MFKLILELSLLVSIVLFVFSLFFAYFIHCVSEERHYRKWRGFKK